MAARKPGKVGKWVAPQAAPARRQYHHGGEMEKQSLTERVRALRHEIKGPDMGGKPRVCGCHRCAEVSSIAAELERIAGHLRGDLRDDEDWSERACEVAAALADPKEGV